MEETVEQTRPVRFLDNRYWSDEHGAVGAREAALLGSLLRTAYRKDHDGRGVTEGFLANWLHKPKTDEMWKIALQRCVTWKWVELIPAYSGEAVRVVLTSVGKRHAIQLCCERQRAGKPVDVVEE